MRPKQWYLTHVLVEQSRNTMHNSYSLFSFSFLFHGILAHIITSWSLMRPRKKRLKSQFHSPVGQSLTESSQLFFEVFGMLLACIGQQFNSEYWHNSYSLFSFSFLFHGILAHIITSWSLMRPRKKRLKSQFHSPVGSKPN